MFPLQGVDEPALRRATCERAVAAVREARSRVRAANERRVGEGLRPFHYGVGLHVGRVLYGNIGTVQRLEFSVIGAAANETARIEGLCKRTQSDAVVSQPVIDEIGVTWPSLGKFELAGVVRPMEVFSVPAS